MSNEQKNQMSAMDVFSSVQETFAEAKKKMADETRTRSQFLRMSKDGTYLVRILPLAPERDPDGNWLPMKRKGYEYPIRDLLLKIDGTDNNGKPKTQFVSVCNAKQVFPDLKDDLIDKFVEVACRLYADDEALCKKLKENSFSGGLKWSSRRCMYVLDMDHREDGIQILSLSYSQYKELEERKMNVWTKMLKKKDNAPCPISSFDSAYPIEIIRKTENKKTNYSINIAIEEGVDVLAEEELERLLDTPQLPSVLYRYTRYHLEATLAFLKQVEEKMDIEVLKDDEIVDCIDQIKMLLPADDVSHFQFNSDDSGSSDGANALDVLWDTYDKLTAEGLDDKTEEGQDLRASIKEYIDSNELGIRVTRGKTNLDLLNEIEGVINDDGVDKDSNEHKAAQDNEPKPDPKEEQDDEDDDEPAQPELVRSRSRNEDTNEPAARQERRTSRPIRRR